MTRKFPCHLADNYGMNAWVVIAVIVGVVVMAAALKYVLRSKEDRAASRELRQLRSKERTPNLRAAKEHRYNMMMDQIPGKDTHPGGA